MNLTNKMAKTDNNSTTRRPIQRTLIMTLGPLARAAAEYLRPALADTTALAGVVALFDVDASHDDPASSIRERLAGISRAGSREELATNGYVMDRMNELALFAIVDATDQESTGMANAVIGLAASVAQAGWGLETRAIMIALADDWAEVTPHSALKALLETASESLVSLIPLNRVNELGLEMDSHEAYLTRAVAIVEALATTPLRDVPQWANSLQEPMLIAPGLTTVGLDCWTWEPKAVRDSLAQAWQQQITGHWLASARPEQAQPAAQRATNWFASQGLLSDVLIAMLGRSTPVYPVPSRQLPYPWRAAEAIDRLYGLSKALATGHGGAVELLLHDRDEWLIAQEQSLRAELATQLDREPVAGIDLAGRFLQELATIADDSEDTAGVRRDELEQQTADLTTRLDETLGKIEAILQKWPPDAPLAWATMLLRPWRWSGLVREYWTLHNLAREAEQLVIRQAEIAREQELAAAAGALYQQLTVAFSRAACHLDEVRDMLQARHSVIGASPATELSGFITGTVAQDSTELVAVDVARKLGGLGRLAHDIDEGVVSGLADLARQRYAFLIDNPAVDVLPWLYEDAEDLAGWWQALWAGATPLWLYDDAGQPEASRVTNLAGITVCANGADRLRQMLGLPDLPDWRWLPMNDRRRIIVMRWRTGVALQ